MVDIGVLALQGSVAEHLRMLSLVEGVNAVEVKTSQQLECVSGLIIPGGESTTLGKLIREFELAGTIVKLAEAGMPVWGTCAGMILMAKKIINENYVHLGIMDIAVRRNAYGGQLESFSTGAIIPSISQHSIPLVFIRAPWVESIWGDGEMLAQMGERIVAVKQRNMLVTSFHPELTNDLTFHRYFAAMAKQWQNQHRDSY